MFEREKIDISVNSEEASLVFKSQGDSSHFFGYYGISPWSYDNSKILAHRTHAKETYIRQDDIVDLGWFDLETSIFHKFEETTACNWQQGAMLRWLPGAANETVIFNRRERGLSSARVVNLLSGQKIDFHRPIHAVSPDGKVGFSLSVERLYYTRRAYSYEGCYSEKWNKPIVEEDGIFFVDLVSGDIRLIISLKELAQRDNHPTMFGARHWLDHPLIAPDSRRFLFYHRWMTKDGTFFTRLYTANLDGSDLVMYPDSGMYSHAAWLDSTNFVVFARPTGSDFRTTVGQRSFKHRVINLALPVYRLLRNFEVIRGLRKRVLSDRYFLFSVNDEHKGRILSNLLVEDGHPSFNPNDSSLMLTDTYPDSQGRQHLLLLNQQTDEVKCLARIQSPRGYDATTPNRCDLHPRWDNLGQHVCIDIMTRLGTRQICVLKLKTDDKK